ncbi:MAG: DNA (cytosine-5-)-methyltransferase [Dehalococcoidia bacterium]|nr:DNA (cytosine-5-)-methyltransferase [Dehalococcoidia bacterium]
MQVSIKPERPPLPPQKFTFIDLFAGIGGMRIGFEEAGGRSVFSSEWDRWAQATYELNFGEKPRGDIRKVNEHTIPDHDVLVAGFPCQPFSIAGVSKKNALDRPHGFLDETQGTLFFDIERILRAKKPRAVVLENVRNLISHDKGRTFETIRRHLRAAGYLENWQLVSARPFVPQSRTRIFIVALRAGPKFVFPPTLTHEDRYPVLADVLDTEVPKKYTLTDHLWAYLQRYAEKHRAAGNGFGFGLSSPDGIARTLSARYYKDGSEILIHQEGRNPRRLTPEECRRLMKFPDWFKIEVSDTQAYKQFGNSVVVPVVQRIAEALVPYLSIPETGVPDPLARDEAVGAQTPLGLV